MKRNECTQHFLVGNYIFSFRFILQTNILEEITTSPTSSQASLVVADIVMTGNELMEIRESTTAGIQTTGMTDCVFTYKRSAHKRSRNHTAKKTRSLDVFDFDYHSLSYQ